MQKYLFLVFDAYLVHILRYFAYLGAYFGIFWCIYMRIYCKYSCIFLWALL